MVKFLGVLLILGSLAFGIGVGSNLLQAQATARDFDAQITQYQMDEMTASNGLVGAIAGVGVNSISYALGVVQQKEHEDELELGVAGFFLVLGVFFVFRRKRPRPDQPVPDQPFPAASIVSIETADGSTGMTILVFAFIFVAAVMVITGVHFYDLRHPSADQAQTTVTPVSHATEAEAGAVPVPSDWTLDHTTNPVTGVVTTVASTTGEHNIVVRLIGKKLDCYINTPDFLETVDIIEGGSSTVQYRFDNGQVIRQGWGLGEDNTSLFGESHCTSFVALLRKSKTLAFEYKPADKVATTTIFNVAGFPAEFMPSAPPTMVPPKANAAAKVSDTVKHGLASMIGRSMYGCKVPEGYNASAMWVVKPGDKLTILQARVIGNDTLALHLQNEHGISAWINLAVPVSEVYPGMGITFNGAFSLSPVPVGCS